MIDEVEILLAKIRKYDPEFSPKSTGKYLLTELQSRHLDYQMKHKKRPKYKHRFANSIVNRW
ncbi:TPA_asm: hypothetical protein GJA98_13120 [Listeria monocytogenes]|uniref:hypothetical protein n=1 Tax=Listeria monocytogenes TaxID=1639 RepID=UPI000E70B684|nr:hypothetical protein [Listeria monocytogenes]EAC2922533.1 hypothetical protein [Listeria monocytogenes]EAD2103922.1 hypothetical protein [Listeria monocytogenes]EAD4729603.1 hypothetical protein [Listeria monocytogenes]EAF2184340.1 hypothetical protein [Listeria monocytogenes]EEO6183964.1 hypothetical protein [Listeria monocytogenes]